MDNKKITPINRVNKFFSEEDYELQITMGREAIEDQGNFVLILYKIDREMTQSDDLYGEAVVDGIRFFPPVELKVVPIIEKADNKSYNPEGTLRYIQDGKLLFGIYQEQLNELKTEINYGDYIGYPINETEIRYYSVVNDGIKNFDNQHTILGYKSAFRTVMCAAVDLTEFRGI